MPAYPSRLSKTRAGFGRLPSVSGSPRRGVVGVVGVVGVPEVGAWLIGAICSPGGCGRDGRPRGKGAPVDVLFSPSPLPPLEH